MARTTIRSEDITDGQVKAVDLASDAVTPFDDSGLQDDIAILGFKVAANGSLAKYDLVDQTIDAFQDASGIDAGASTDEVRNAANYYSGVDTTPAGITAFTTVETTSWTAPTGLTSLEVLVVGGGGAGGKQSGGGGGGGGVVHQTSRSVTPDSSYTVTVGAGGGYPASGFHGESGGNSVFDTITAVGGGGAGGYGATTSGASGGSGGGGGPRHSGSTGGSATQGNSGGGTGYGNDGGNSATTSGEDGSAAGCGGGGANGVGSSNSGSGHQTGGNGGVGKEFTNFSAHGESGFFAGGGGGGGYTHDGNGGTGGNGGGGDGGSPGTASSGGGGGGGSYSASTGYTNGSGGSGVVLLYTDAINIYNDMTLISNSTTAEATPTKGDIVMTYTNGAGTATVNTDIKGWVSRDDGTTYTQFTLVDEGDTGGHIILTAHDLDISGQPSGTSMRYKITTHNQDASLETRIQAISLGWS